ncbi:hypothetical protein D1BOALGB6SA_10340 [Olavius sp. associated proteobacterium Delta 1]|nr:hypothetical protein D1BOALGB6SA_10340 [Olavius sp. associated proteobacterium Delta 1]
MARLMQAFLVVVIVSVGLLMVGGLVLDVIQGGYGRYYSFFHYRIRVLNHLPFWFAAVLFQLAINGVWIPRLSRHLGESDFSPFRQYGRISWNVPIQYGILFGKNLALVCGILFMFVLVQAMRI